MFVYLSILFFFLFPFQMFIFVYFLLLFFLNQFQSCPLTDEYLTRCHCGILTNGESYIKCEENSLKELPKFKRSFPYDELILRRNQITNLPATSFDNIRTIKRINLQGNSLSSIDNTVLRSLGNYLEELSLTGNDQIDSLEFLTRYPLKKLRVLKLDRFNLRNLNLRHLFSNMTKLEIVYLQSCQLIEIPNLSNLQVLNLENNLFSQTIFLSTNHQQINLANNRISSLILQTNENLISLNLSRNLLVEFYASTISNKKLQILDLSLNQLSFLDWTILNNNLRYLNLSYNQFEKFQFYSYPKSLQTLDLQSNQLKTLDKTRLFQQLIYLNLNHNPFECNCQLKWLDNLMKRFSSTTWKCSSDDFKCFHTPRLISLNITYLQTGLLVQWLIIDKTQTIDHLQITIEQPFQISEQISSNQTRVLIANDLQTNKIYHICLIIVHKYARDKYCKDILTTNPSSQSIEFDKHEILFQSSSAATANQSYENHFYLLLIASCIGGLLTFVLLLTCCYLCFQIHRYKISRKQPVYEKCSQHQYVYPIYHTQPHCTHQQILYNSENLSNSTDSTHMDTSLSTTTNNNPKHIYQTIDSQDYSSLSRHQHHQLFHLWNESVQQKR